MLPSFPRLPLHRMCVSRIGIPFLLRRFLAGAWNGRRERFVQPLGIHRDLDTRALLLEQHHRARIAAAPATRESFRHLGEREIAHAHGHAEVAAERIGERNVLVGELEREGRRIVLAGQELVDQSIERKTAPGRALAHRLPQRGLCRSWTTSLKPALCTLAAMRPPMVPSPTNPTTTLSLDIASPSLRSSDFDRHRKG